MLKLFRFALLIIMMGIVLYGVVTVNLAYQPLLFLLMSVYILTLTIQAYLEKKRSLMYFFAALCVVMIGITIGQF